MVKVNSYQYPESLVYNMYKDKMAIAYMMLYKPSAYKTNYINGLTFNNFSR